MNKEIVVFDFDGTLTTKDTLFEFIKYAKGYWNFFFGLIICSPILLTYLLRITPNYKAKEYLFSHFFKDMKYQEFKQLGINFSKNINQFTRKNSIEALRFHQREGRIIYVISASIEEWIKPWCQQHEINNVLGTKIEVANGKLTGRFLSKNCYGQEKVNRLKQCEPNRTNYYLYAYGDSNGDKEMLNYADEAIWIK